MVLETLFETASGTAAVIGLMVANASNPAVVQIVEGRIGRIDMMTGMVLRFNYGLSIP